MGDTTETPFDRYHRMVVIEHLSPAETARRCGVSAQAVNQVLRNHGVYTGLTPAGLANRARCLSARYRSPEERRRRAEWSKSYRSQLGIPPDEIIVAAYHKHGQSGAARVLGLSIGQVAGIMHRHRKAKEARS